MSRIEEYFFIILRSAIWGTVPVLPRIPTIDEWNEIARLSKEQTVIGIMMDAIAKLPEEQKPETKLRLQWIVMQKRIEVMNTKMNSIIKSIFCDLQRAGTRAILLKGQGVAQNYIQPLHRQCGDIDIYILEEHFHKAISYFESIGCKLNNDSTSYQIETTYKGIPIELHKKSAAYYTKKLQNKYEEISRGIIGKENAIAIIDNTEIEILPYMADAFQLLSHMKRHIYSSGIALRQICDWVYFVYHHQSKLDIELFVRNMKTLQLYETYKAIMAIAIDYLGLPKEFAVCEITSRDKSLANEVLSLIMAYGNFGHYGEHDKTNTKWEYLKSYIWKIRNCIRFHRIAGNDAWNYPIWQLHSIRKFLP